MQRSPNPKRAKVRARLASDVADFLDRGGVIEHPTFEDNKAYRDRHVKRGPHIPMQIIDKEKHRWSRGDFEG